jgi:hypothetical protein
MLCFPAHGTGLRDRSSEWRVIPKVILHGVEGVQVKRSHPTVHPDYQLSFETKTIIRQSSIAHSIGPAGHVFLAQNIVYRMASPQEALEDRESNQH